MSHLHSPAPAPGAGVRQAVSPRRAPGPNGVQVLRAPEARGSLLIMRGLLAMTDYYYPPMCDISTLGKEVVFSDRISE